MLEIVRETQRAYQPASIASSSLAGILLAMMLYLPLSSGQWLAALAAGFASLAVAGVSTAKLHQVAKLFKNVRAYERSNKSSPAAPGINLPDEDLGSYDLFGGR